MVMIEQERSEARKTIHDDALVNVVALAALWAVISDLIEVFMMLSLYSNLQPADFSTYHAFTPYLKVSGATAFMTATWLRGHRYWLIYAIPLILIASQIILLGLIRGTISPDDLQWFNHGPDWWRSQTP